MKKADEGGFLLLLFPYKEDLIMSFKEWCIVLVLPVLVLLGVAQCSYDNYVKYKISKAADKVAEGK